MIAFGDLNGLDGQLSAWSFAAIGFHVSGVLSHAYLAVCLMERPSSHHRRPIRIKLGAVTAVMRVTRRRWGQIT
jgi:hypothetical protein